MGKLGNLYYEILFKDGTDAGIKAIEDKIKKLNAKLALGIDERGLVNSIQTALSKKFTIQVDAAVNMSAITQQVQSAVKTASETAAKAASASVSSGKSGTKSATSKTAKTQSEFLSGDHPLNAKYSLISDKNAKDAERYAKELERAQSALSSVAQKMSEMRSRGLNKFTKPIYDRLESERSQLFNTVQGLKAISSMNASLAKVGTTMPVTNLPAPGSASAKAEAEMARVRHASRESDIKAAFAARDAEIKAAKDIANARAKAEEQRLKSLSQYQERFMSFASKYRSVSGALGVKNGTQAEQIGYTAYAKGISNIMRKNAEALSAISQGKTPSANLKQLSAEMQTLKGYFNQYKSISDGISGLRGRIANAKNIAANNPGRADFIGNQISILRNYSTQLKEARQVYARAMSGNAEARARLDSGAFSSEWFNRIQSSAQRASIAIGNMTKGMNVTNYASNLRAIADELANVGDKGSRLGEILGGVFSVYAAKEFFNNLVQIGGEFEKQKLALAAMFDSATRAGVLYSQIQALAVESPFTFGELTSYTKQLSAYGLEYKDIYDTTKRLADISAAVGVPMSRIILAYGQVSTAKFLRGQELRQFTEAGIPMVQALADRFTKLRGEMVSASQVFDMISNKEVKFEDVRAVLQEMTNPGGRFYNMQEVLAESLSGKWANFQDSVEIMFSEIETSGNSLLKGIVGTMTKVVYQWRDLLKIGSFLLTMYSALAAKRAISNAINLKSVSINARMIANEHANAEALERETAAFNAQTAAIGANSSAKAKNALARNARSLVLRGADYRQVYATAGGSSVLGMGSYARLQNDAALVRRISQLKTQLSQANSVGQKFATSMNLGFAQMSMKARMFGLSLKAIGASLSSMFLNPAFLAITALSAGVSWWMGKKQEAEERSAHAEESKKGLKQMSEEISKFLDSNSLDGSEFTVDGKLKFVTDMDETTLNKTMDDIKTQIENSPIDMSFAVEHSESITDAEARLTYLIEKLKEAKNVADGVAGNAANGNKFSAAEVSAKIQDETDGWFDEPLDKNVKDFSNALSEYNQVLLGYNADTFGKINETFQSSIKTLGELSPELQQIKKDLDSAFDASNIIEYENAYQRFRLQMSEEHRNSGRYDLSKFALPVVDDRLAFDRTGIHADYDTLLKDVETAKEIMVNAGLDFRHMSDEGYLTLQKYVTDYSTAQKMSADDTRIFLEMLEEQATATANATWKNNSSGIDTFVENLKSSYGNLFKDKKITDGFSDSQKDAIRKTINMLPEYMGNLKAALLAQIDEINKASAANPIVVKILTKTEADTSGLPQFSSTDAQTQYDKVVSMQSDAFWADLRPNKDESTLDYIERIKKTAKEKGKQLSSLKKIKNKTDATNRQIDTLQKGYDNLLTVADRFQSGAKEEIEGEVGKEDKKKTDKANKAASKAESAAEKAERKRLKALQERIQRYKDFKSMYEKFADIYGEVNALQKVKESGLYSSLEAPDTLTSRKAINEWVKGKMADIHAEAGSKTAEQRNVGESALKTKIDLETELDKEQLEKDLNALEREIKLTNEKWSRYLTFRDIGLSQKQAIQMTFGDGSSGKGDNNGMSVNQAKALDYRRQVEEFLSRKQVVGENIDELLGMDKDQLKLHFNGNQQILNELTPLVEAYREAWLDVIKDNDSMYKTMLENAKSYTEKLADVNRVFGRQEYAISMGEAEYAKTNGKSGISPELATRMRASNAQQKATESGKVKMEQLQNSARYLDFFNAAASLTIAEAEDMADAIRQQLVESLKAGEISVKDFSEEAKKLEDSLADLKSKPQSALEALLKGGLSGLTDFKKNSADSDFAKAANEYYEAETAKREAEKNGNTQEAQLQGAIMAQALSKMDKARDAKRNATDQERRQGNASNAFSMLGDISQGLSSFRDTLGDTIVSLGGKTDTAGFQTFSTVVDSFSDLAAGGKETFQKIMSGDFIGGAFSAVTGPLKVITAFNKLHDSKLQKQIELSEDRQKDIKAAADQIEHAIQTSLGTENAKTIALDSYKQLAAQYSVMSTQNKNKNNKGYFDLGNSYANIFSILSGNTSLKGKSSQEILEALGFDANSSYLNYMVNYKNGGQISTSDIYNAIAPGNISDIEDATQAIEDWSAALNASAKDKYKAEELLYLKKEGFFDADSISAYGAEYLSLLEQRRELESQIADESSKKNTDDEVIQSKREELTSLNQQISEFKDNVLKEVLGLDFSDFASQLAQNLTSAFEQGQDAAEAFEDTVNNVLKTVVQNAIKESVIAPYISKLKEQIEDAYDINNPASIDKVVDLIYNSEGQLMDVVADGKAIFDKVNEKTHGALTDTSSSNTLTGNVKNLTEETGTLLTSYLNAIRADVSISRGIWEKLSQENFAQMDVIMESQLKQLSLIAQSNQLIADNTSSNLEAVTSIKDYLGSIITVGSGGKAVRIK